MKIVKNNIAFKGEKYRAVIKTGVFITVKLYKTNKFFPVFRDYADYSEFTDYPDLIKKIFHTYEDVILCQEKSKKLYQDLQEWNGVTDENI